MEGIFNAIRVITEQNDEESTLTEAVVFAAWHRIAGSELDRHTVPLEFGDNTLEIAVADRMWQAHLRQLSKQMLFRLNSIFRQPIVKRLEFTIDSGCFAEFASRSEDSELAINFEKRALNEIDETLKLSAESIEDPCLREKFLLAAGGCLARINRSTSAST